MKSSVQLLSDLKQKQAEIIAEIKALDRRRELKIHLLATTIRLRQELGVDENGLALTPEIEAVLNPHFTIGDAIERILKECRPLTRAEILAKLKQAKVPISETNARIVVFNAVTRDKKNRFIILENGKVTLRKEIK